MKFEKLQVGDTVGIICPASSISKDNPRIPVMEKYLNGLGLKVKYGKNDFASYGYLAGTDEQRAADLEAMYLDEEVKAVLCMKGGYGCSRMVDRIDFSKIAKHPKLLIGFSDVTVLLNAIQAKTGLPTIHGAVGIWLGSPKADAASRADFEALIFQNQKGRVLKNPKDNAKTLKEGAAEGKLIGGNLSLIATLAGTPYDLDFTDKIVFIEDVDEAPYRIDRYLSNLRLAGKLEQAKGFVLGYFTGCEPKEKGSWEISDLLKQYFGNLSVPVITDFASGHDFPFLNLPIGIRVKMDAQTKTITIMEELYETH